MPLVACPDCMQEGRVPDSFLGRRIKCSKCGGASWSRAPRAVPPPGSEGTSSRRGRWRVVRPLPSTPTFEGIVVEGFEGGWSESQDDTTAEVPAEPPREARTPSFGASMGVTGLMRPEGVKEYKLLTPKDKVFDNKFDLARLEEVINAYATERMDGPLDDHRPGHGVLRRDARGVARLARTLTGNVAVFTGPASVAASVTA